MHQEHFTIITERDGYYTHQVQPSAIDLWEFLGSNRQSLQSTGQPGLFWHTYFGLRIHGCFYYTYPWISLRLERLERALRRSGLLWVDHAFLNGSR